MIDPIFDPNDVLPNDPYLQIPLDAQPIDLEGLSAQGKQRQWIHPDNIIPTTASMHGQKYSNMQQAQVATFNDDKQLRVEATIAGGGASAAPYAISLCRVDDTQATSLAPDGDHVGQTIGGVVNIWGAMLAAVVHGGGGGAMWLGFVAVRVVNGRGLVKSPIWDLPIASYPAGGSGSSPAIANVHFSTPIAISDDGSGSYIELHNYTNQTIDVMGALMVELL